MAVGVAVLTRISWVQTEPLPPRGVKRLWRSKNIPPLEERRKITKNMYKDPGSGGRVFREAGKSVGGRSDLTKYCD